MKKLPNKGILLAVCLIFLVTIIFFLWGFYDVANIKDEFLEQLITENETIIQMLSNRFEYNIKASDEDLIIINDQEQKISESLETLGSRNFSFTGLYRYENGELVNKIEQNDLNGEIFDPFLYPDFLKDIAENTSGTTQVLRVRADGRTPHIYLTYKWLKSDTEDVNLLLLVAVGDLATENVPQSLILSQSLHLAVVILLLSILLIQIFRREESIKRDKLVDSCRRWEL